MDKKPIKVIFTDMQRPFDRGGVEQSFEWRMISKHWHPILSDDPDFLFYSCNGPTYLKYHCIRIFYTPENIRPNFKRCDYAFSYDYPVNARNYRLPIYRRWPEYNQLFRPRDPERISAEPRKFCSFMVSNASATERIEFYNKLSTYKKVDSGGRLLNNIGYNIERGSESKLKWMRNYKFSITFENASYPGYTTEKLMHALISDTIPIYWGDPLVANDFNPKAFVNCLDFHSYSEVVELIREIDHNDNLYREYLSQPYLKDNKETDFCREENIVGRYDEILSSKRYFVSPIRKKIQRPLYELSVLNKLAAKAFRTIKGYGNQAILVLRQKIQGLRK